MTTDIKIPALGESISEGVVSAWLKEDGEFVERDEPILELETDKITMEVPAPVAGAVSRSVEEGETVAVGQVVGAIDESAEQGDAGAEKKAAEEKKPAKQGQGGDEDEKKEEREASEQKQKQPASAEKKQASGAGGEQSGKDASAATKEQPAVKTRQTAQRRPGEGRESQEAGDVPATPLARKLAEEHNVHLTSISGTGAGGRVREQDVLAYIQTHHNGAAGAGEASPDGLVGVERTAGSSRGVRVERMTPLRQRVAARLVEAQRTAAMLTTFNECDMSEVMALRSRHKEAFEQRHGVKLGFMSFFVKACVSALEAHPRVNAFIVQHEGGAGIEQHDYCDIAVAVGTKKGLVVPVLRNCQTRSFAEVEEGILELAEKARQGKLSLDDMQGGTFTISNGGVYGSMLSTPILNPPQSGILGMHNIIRRPVERPDKPGSGEVVVRPMMYLALSYDHRMVDGAEAVGFLKHIKECIESPERLLLEV